MLSPAKIAWYQDVEAELQSSGVVDAHNHILGRKQRLDANPDLFDWIAASYYLSSLLSSGMNAEEFRARGPNDAIRRWQVLRPHLERTRNCSYAALIDLATRDLFQFPFFDLNDRNWPELSERFRSASKDPQWFETVLGKKMNMQLGLLDGWAGGNLMCGISHSGGWYDYILRARATQDDASVNRRTIVREIDTRFFRPVFKIDSLLYGYGPGCLSEIAQLFKVDVEGGAQSLSDYLQVVDKCFQRIVALGGVGIKSAIMGLRTLDFPRTERSDAERIFGLTPEKRTKLDAIHCENYLMNVMVEKSIEHHLPFQIHTGTAFAGYSCDDNGRPVHLFNLISQHPDAQFDLLHGGYPYSAESATLAARFPNVYLNFSYFTMHAPNEARRAIASWIEMIPIHKFAWGSDCVYVEETYGAFLQARRVFADALWDRIEDGWLDKATALQFIRAIFHDNPARLFRTGSRSERVEMALR